MSEELDREIMFTRRVLCAMIGQAVVDAKNDRHYMRSYKRLQREFDQNTAIAFLNSEFYKDLCKALGDCSRVGIPADKIKLEAMK